MPLTPERSLRGLLGVSYIVAGVAKLLPGPESTAERLKAAAVANTGTNIESFTRTLVDHAGLINVGIAAAMTSAGLALARGQGPIVDASLVCTLPMLGGFVAVLRRSVPVVIPIDLVYSVSALYLLAARRAT